MMLKLIKILLNKVKLKNEQTKGVYTRLKRDVLKVCTKGARAATNQPRQESKTSASQKNRAEQKTRTEQREEAKNYGKCRIQFLFHHCLNF